MAIKILENGLQKAKKAPCPECTGNRDKCLYRERRTLNDMDMEFCKEHLFVLAFKKLKPEKNKRKNENKKTKTT